MRKLFIAGIATVVTTASFLSTSAATAAADRQSVQPSSSSLTSSAGLSPQQQDDVLGGDWRHSADVSWNLISAATGLTVIKAPVASGGQWAQVASLHIAGVESRQWIGQGCLLPHSHTLAVTFGPVEYISTTALFERGAFAALVNLDSGQVTGLPLRPTFSYFSPGCSADGLAAFTSFGTDESTTSVSSVSQAGIVKSVAQAQPGELTSAQAASDGTVTAVIGRRIVQLHGTQRSTLYSGTNSISNLRLLPNGLTYEMDHAGKTELHQLLAGHDRVLATSSPGDMTVDTLATGGISAHGSSLQPLSAAAGVSFAKSPRAMTASLAGQTFSAAEGMPSMTGGVSVADASPAGATVSQQLPSSLFQTTEGISFGVRHPAAQAASTTSSVTTDPNLPCAIQRNDPNTEAYQPSVSQIEWSVDQAVMGNLLLARSAGYRGYGLPLYSAQSMFPLAALTGGGTVPPQIMLGILANESNLWQASSHVSPGGYGNPLTGNIYGRSTDSNGNETLTIDFSQADCGYGIAQQTDGMRTGQTSATNQRAIALDYQVNIAAGLNTLIGKWNQLASFSPKIQMNNGDPSSIENWYAAIWAYNSGLQPNAANGNTTGCNPGPSCNDGAGNWGLGWANNPANPMYPSNRTMFNSNGTDAAHPSDWPYQERVIGWAAYPIYEPGGSYNQAWWTTDANRTSAIPNPSLFCTAANHCTAGSTPTSAGSCGLSNLHCWTHYPVTWKSCGGQCGNGSFAYKTTDAEPSDPTTQDPADCNTTALPSSAVIVDDLPSSAPAAGAPCHSVSTTGSFNFTFTADANGNYPAHIDLHQINGGLNGHYWFTHTSQDSTADLNEVGTWTFPSSTVGWGNVMVHVPALGAQTLQAHYSIVDGATGSSQSRILNQDWGSNSWVSLGAFNFTANEKVNLSSYAPNDTGGDIAWDAVAFVPTSQPVYKVVALGDSYSAGEGLAPFIANTSGGCDRSNQAYANLITLPGQTTALGQNGADQLSFVACSGSHTTSITSNAVSGTGQEIPYDSGWGGPRYEHGEEQQITQGYLDATTDAVTVSIGGNDSRFADVVKTCAISDTIANNCSANGYIMQGDTQPLNQEEPHILRDLLPAKLQATYLAIHAAAPNATIFVVGYPKLFPTTQTGQTNCPADMPILPVDQTWLNSMADIMTTTIQSTVTALQGQGVKIHYVDPVAAFTGHDICQGSNAWLNAIVGLPTSPGPGSFHPKASGQIGYANLVTAAMAQYLPKK